MSDILERAAHELITRPPSSGALASQLRERLDRRRHRRGRAIILLGCLVAIGGVIVIRSRDTDAPQPASNVPVTSSTAAPVTSTKVACDDNGCNGFDRLPVEAGADDYYVGPESLGDPTVDLPTFENLTRCAELSADFTTCVRIEGAAFVGLVSYPALAGTTEDTTNRTAGSYQIHIGTTFADVSPEQYASDARSSLGGGENPPSAVTVRGHAAIAYTSGDGPAVVWQERAGVLVWLTVPPEDADQLLTIANGVRRIPGPTDIPSRVMVAGTGHPYDASRNNGDGLVVARAGGQVCAGYGFVGTCSQDIADLTFIDASNPDAVSLAGWTSANVTSVKFEFPTSVGDFVAVDTQQFADYDGRFFDFPLQSADSPTPLPTHVEWLDATNAVVAQADIPPIDPSVAALGWRSWASLTQQPAGATIVPPPATLAPSTSVDAAASTAPTVESSTTDAPGPAGAMVLPESSGFTLAGASNEFEANTDPIRYYASSQPQPENGPYLVVYTLRNAGAANTGGGCDLSSESQTTLADGTTGCLQTRNGSVGFGRLTVRRSPDTILIEGNATDAQLLDAANHVVPSDSGPADEVATAGLPAGVTQTGVGWTVSDFATTSLDVTVDPIVLMNWSTPDGRLLFLAAAREDQAWLLNHRLDHKTIIDVTTRDTAGFIRTIAGQPNYLGLVWHENGITYQVGSQGLTQTELLALVEQMRPATAAEWSAMSSGPTLPDSTTTEVATTIAG
ncbi:MAG: hypothetical protein JWL72_973 [Ilumatobacteraceae bacterium]|nr:hypothetical protein [Ilumatobacteraceae bacterium]